MQRLLTASLVLMLLMPPLVSAAGDRPRDDRPEGCADRTGEATERGDARADRRRERRPSEPPEYCPHEAGEAMGD